jgi:hypothetical protein
MSLDDVFQRLWNTRGSSRATEHQLRGWTTVSPRRPTSPSRTGSREKACCNSRCLPAGSRWPADGRNPRSALKGAAKLLNEVGETRHRVGIPRSGSSLDSRLKLAQGAMVGAVSQLMAKPDHESNRPVDDLQGRHKRKPCIPRETCRGQSVGPTGPTRPACQGARRASSDGLMPDSGRRSFPDIATTLAPIAESGDEV